MFFRALCVSFILFFNLASISAQITIINPSNTEVLNMDSVEFLWSANDLGDFELQLSTNSSFSTTIFVDTVFAEEEVTVNNLSPGLYFWRIRNLTVGLTWSTTYSFELINIDTMSGLSFWLKPESGFISDGSNKISSWNNQVSSNHAIQSTSASQPLKVDNALNTHAVVRFDGANDNLEFGYEVDIREVFVVCNHTTGSQNYAPILGDAGSQPDFHGGITNKLFNTTFTDAKIVNGSVQVNGQGQAIAAVLKPQEFAVYSISTTDSVKTNTIAKDRGFLARSWSGDYAEVIFFNQSIGSSQKDKINDYLKWKYTPIPFLGKDVLVCGESITLSVPSDNDYSSVTWSTGSNNVDSINVTQNGTYWVSVESFGMTFRDTIVVGGIIPKPQISISNDITLCYGDSVMASYSSVAGFDHVWSNGDSSITTYFKDLNQAIFAIHTDTNGCVASSDNYNLYVDSISIVSTLGPDRNVCLGSDVEVVTSASGPFSYSWNTGDTTSSVFPVGVGSQSLSITMTNDNNCIFEDTVIINVLSFQAPSIQFNSDTVCLNTPTQFVDASVPAGSDQIISWTWYFGNTDSAFIPNPTYSFSSQPSSVSLTVETDSGCVNTSSQIVYNHELPNALFDDFIICANDSLSISNNAFVPAPDSIISYDWQINTDFYSGETPVVLIPNQGIKAVSLTVVTNNGCADTLVKNIEVYPALVPDFAVEGVCLNDTSKFSDITNSFSVISRTWDFDFFNQTSMQENPSFFYPNAGTYNVSLSVTNAIGCSSDTTKTIEIKSPPQAEATIDNNCLGSNTLFFDNSTVIGGVVNQSQWLIEGDTIIGDSINFMFEEVAEYGISYQIVDNFGCEDDTSFNIQINSLPTVDFDFTPNYGTAPITVQFSNQSIGGVNYLWNFGDGNTSLVENPSNTYNNNGVYDIILSVENQFNCVDSLIKTIPIIPTELDVELSNLTIVNTTLVDGSNAYKARITMKNIGSRNIENIDLKAAINQDTKVVETWEGQLGIGQSLIYELGSSFLVADPSLLDYLCVEAFNVNDNTETNIANNKVCKLQQGIVRFSKIYPNPSNDYAYMDIVTAQKGFTEIKVYDQIGKEVLSLGTLELQEGFNQVFFNCANFQAGKYFIQMVFQDEVYSQSLIIRNK